MWLGCARNPGESPSASSLPRANLNVSQAAQRLGNFLNASTEELKDFTRLTGNADIHGLSVPDLCTTNSEINSHTDVEHV